VSSATRAACVAAVSLLPGKLRTLDLLAFGDAISLLDGRERGALIRIDEERVSVSRRHGNAVDSYVFTRQDGNAMRAGTG
jgi:hypothetical protein